MKQYFHPVNIAFGLLACCLLLCACVDEEESRPGAGGGGSLKLTLRVPGIPSSTATRSVSLADECGIATDQLHLLLFSKSDGKYIFLRDVGIRSLTVVPDSDPATYDLQLAFHEGEMGGNYRLMAVANLTKGAFLAAAGGEGYPAFRDCNTETNPMESVRELLTYANPGDAATGRWPLGGTGATFVPFPMWGEGTSFTASPGADLGTLSLVRATARIDVGINFRRNADDTYPLADMRSRGLEATTGGYFRLMSVSLYRAPRSGFTAPAGGRFDAANNRVTAATAMRDAAPDDPRRYIETDLSADPDAAVGTEADNRRALTRALYIPEAENHGRDRDRAVCIVVGGAYGDAAAPTTFYRIDFYNRTPGPDGNQLKPTPDSRIDLLRNHAYVVNITSVNGPGESTEEEALVAEHVNMRVELTDWNQDDQLGNIITDGVYRLRMDRTALEYYSDGMPQQVTLETDYEGESGQGWTLEADETAQRHVIFYDDDGKEIRFTDPEWPHAGRRGITRLRVGMAEFDQPVGTTDPQFRQATLIFTAGNMKMRLRLTQTSRELLRIGLAPGEMYFPQIPQFLRPVDIQVNTRKTYDLSVAWRNERDEPCTWNLSDPSANPAMFPDPRFADGDFFAVDPARPDYPGRMIRQLRPTATSAGNNRVFTFTLTATVPATGATATAVLLAYQSEFDVEWLVRGGTGPFGNEALAAHDAASVSARIETKPVGLEWYFSRSTDVGPIDWITNLDALIGTKQNGGGQYTFDLLPNTALGRRSYTLQARSPQDGFDPDNFGLVVVQQSTPLILIPEVQGAAPGALTETVDADNRTIYTRDYGTALASTTDRLDFTANSDWQWWWNKDNLPDFERGVREMFGGTFSAVTTPERTPTTDGPTTGPARKTWTGAFTASTPGLAIPAENELWADARTVPLGGAHELKMELYNHNIQLHPDDVKQYRKRLVFRRSFPSYQNVMHWPYPAGTNLDMHVDEVMTGTETPLRVRTNAKGRIEYYSSLDGVNWGLQQWSDNTAVSGYEEFTQTLLGLGVPVNSDSWKMRKTFVKIRYTGPRRNPDTPDAPDQADWAEERTFFFGTEINVPHRNMGTGQRFLSSAGHTLVFDFGNSFYKQLLVRVKSVLVNTTYDKRGCTAPDIYLNSGGAAGDVLRWPDRLLTVTVPQNGEVNRLRQIVVEYQKDDGAGTVSWMADRSPQILQDAIPCNGGYIVRYENYPNNIHNADFGENGLWRQEHRWDDGLTTWAAASPLQRGDVVNNGNARTSVNDASARGAASCTNAVEANLRGAGRTAVGSAEGQASTKYRGANQDNYLRINMTISHQHFADINLSDVGAHVTPPITVSGDKNGSLMNTVAVNGTIRCDHCGASKSDSRRANVPGGGMNAQFSGTAVLRNDALRWEYLNCHNRYPNPPAVRLPNTSGTTGNTVHPQ